MSYYLARTLTRPFDTVIDDVTAGLRQAGFGVLTDIDISATLKAKLGVDVPRYRILGACNPRLAHEALKVEARLGVMLPCNIIVRETAGAGVEVAAVDPVAAMERTANPALAATAGHVRQLLAQVVDGLPG